MQVPRDLRRRMLEAVEQVRMVDVHERLIPERRRVNVRCDFLAWFSTYARIEARAGGLGPAELALLGDVQSDPDERWSLMAVCWPYVRTTGTGRVILRVAWELFGVEDLDERSWKDVSARLWKASELGFYQDLLCQRANVRATLVDGLVDPESRECCSTIKNCAPFLGIRCRADIDALSRVVGGPSTTLDQLDALLERSLQNSVDEGCVAFKFVMGDDTAFGLACRPSPEEVGWAFQRVASCDDPDTPAEPALRRHLLDQFLAYAAKSERPVVISLGEQDRLAWGPYATRKTNARPCGVLCGPASAERLSELAHTCPEVRFVYLVHSLAGSPFLVGLARTLPNVSLAMGDAWRIAPREARRALRTWVEGVPLQKLFALGGNTALVEAASVQALMVREQVAALLAEMVADGELDERDAHLVMESLLGQNAEDYFGL